jgi:hypothetical protein
MSQREYLAVCATGHRSYLRLDLLHAEGKPPAKGYCTTCGQPAGLVPLGSPGTVTPDWLRAATAVAKAQVEPSPSGPEEAD